MEARWEDEEVHFLALLRSRCAPSLSINTRARDGRDNTYCVLSISIVFRKEVSEGGEH